MEEEGAWCGSCTGELAAWWGGSTEKAWGRSHAMERGSLLWMGSGRVQKRRVWLGLSRALSEAEEALAEEVVHG